MTQLSNATVFEQRHDQFRHLTGPILRDLARNESATREWRKAAIEIMLDKGCPEVNHPDLIALLMEVRSQREAKDEVQSIVETAIEAPLDETHVDDQPIVTGVEPVSQAQTGTSGPFPASFTTKSIYQEDVADIGAEHSALPSRE